MPRHIFSNDRRKRETVKKELIQLGVRPSVHVAEVFQVLGLHVLSTDLVSPWIGVGFANRMGLERPCPTCKNVVTFATRKANVDCGELEWTQCWDVTHEVDDGHPPLASCSRTFLCTPALWKVASECRELCNEIDFGLVCRLLENVITNCEEIHNNPSKLNCRSHVAENCILAMIRGLRQALTRIDCVQAFESGRTVEEPCPAEMAGYCCVHFDSVTGALLPSKLCEEAMQLEISST